MVGGPAASAGAAPLSPPATPPNSASNSAARLNCTNGCHIQEVLLSFFRTDLHDAARGGPLL
jgi:hypothetical protein